MFSLDVLTYMHRALCKEEEKEHEREVAAKGKLPEIFKGNPSEAEHFIYEFSAYFMAHDKEPVLASPVARVVLTLSWVKGEEVDQWVDQQLLSQGSLQEGKRTAARKEWACLTPKTGRMVQTWGW